jgi:integrase
MSNLPRGIYEKVPGSKIYWIRHADSAGKLHREKAGNISTATSLLAIRRADKLRGKLPEIKNSKRLPFSELIDDAIKHSKSENDPYVTHDFELRMDRIRPVFGSRAAASITRRELVDWMDKQASDREWKPSTYNRWRAAFSLVFRVGIENEKISRNPLSGVRRKHEANDRVRYLSLEEEEKLAAALSKTFPSYVPVFVLSANTGMRWSEQLRARVGDYEPTTKMLAVHQQKDRNKPKIRYVPLSKKGVEAYTQLAKGKRSKALLCLNTEGTPMTKVAYWFNPAIKEAGIEDYHWHDNRHTACSRWVMGGVPLAAVAHYAGHSTIQMTMRYSHLVPKVNQAAVDAMDAFYESGSGPETGTDTRTDTGTTAGFQEPAK